MKYDKAKWIATVQKAVVDLKAATPSAGKPTAIAAIRYMRDGLLDDIAGGRKPEDLDEAEKDSIQSIKDGMNELIAQISKDGASEGFASNASAAAKAAGFKSTSDAMVEVAE